MFKSFGQLRNTSLTIPTKRIAQLVTSLRWRWRARFRAKRERRAIFQKSVINDFDCLDAVGQSIALMRNLPQDSLTVMRLRLWIDRRS